MAEPKTTNLGLNLSHPTSPDVRGEWPASMDENLQKIDDFAGSGGGGGVTNTGDLAAGHLVIGNDGADLKVDANFISDGAGSIKATADGSKILIGPDAGQQVVMGFSGSIANFGAFDNDSGFQISADPTNGLAVDGVPLVLGPGAAGPADIIDSTGSHGTAGQVLTSLGPGLGVQWVTL